MRSEEQAGDTTTGLWTGPAGLGLGLFLLTCLVYLPALGLGFLYDDHRLILERVPPRSVVDVLKLFLRSYYEGLPYYRPLTSATFGVQRALHGDTPAVYHAFNVLLGAAVVVLLYSLLRRSAFRVPSWIAAVAAALFALHPVTSSCIYPISGRDSLLAMLWMLATVQLYLHGTRARLGLALATFGLGLLSKESSVVTPGLLALAEWTGVARHARPGLRGPALRLLPFGLVLVAYLLLRQLLFGGTELEAGRPLDVPLSYLYALQVTLIPFLALFYEPPASVWLSPARLAVVAALIAGLAVVTARGGSELRGPVFFWLGWFVIAELPTANLLRQETAFDERYVAVGAVGLVGCVAVIASRHLRSRPAPWLALAGLLAVFLGTIGFVRASYFEEIRFYRQWMSFEPDNVVPHYNLANALSARGRIAESIDEYRRAIELQPGRAEIHGNLGSAYVKAGRVDLALAAYRESVRLAPQNAKAVKNLASALAMQGDLGAALELFREALRLDPGYTTARFELGFALLTMGRDAEAAEQLGEVLRVDPGFDRALTPLGQALWRSGRSEEARRVLEAATRANPLDAEARELLLRIDAGDPPSADIDRRKRPGSG